MHTFNQVFEPQNISLGFEIWVLIGLIVTLTTYGLRVVTDLPTALLAVLLTAGCYLGNVVARALELVAVSTHTTTDMVFDSGYAAFAGMLVVMAIWFIWSLVTPGIVKPRVLKRPNQPQAVVGYGADQSPSG